MYALSASFLSLSALFLSALASPIPDDSPQPDYPDWNQVHIKGVEYTGSGCPYGSVASTLDSAGSFLIIAFDQYTASAGHGVAAAENRKRCKLTFELEYPAGWSLTMFDTRYDGYVKLDKKVSASQESVYHWGGQESQDMDPYPAAAFFSTWKGPVDEQYMFTDSLEEGACAWSSCSGDRSLIIDTEISVDNSKNKKGSGLITTDSVEGKVIQTYGWKWKRCSEY